MSAVTNLQAATNTDAAIDPWLLANLACPTHKAPLCQEGPRLVGDCGCRYPVIDGVPVLLLHGARQTLAVADASLILSQAPQDDAMYLESLGLTEHQRRNVAEMVQRGDSVIDPVVSYMVGATNGIAYQSLVGELREYPIPALRLPAASGQVFLDLGCNWGRWTIAAGRKGYKAVGIDPSLGAVMAARRVARSLGLDAVFLVGDARYLPLKSEAIDQVFSYSVLQHFSREDAALALGEVGRVLRPGGASLIQMPTTLGLRCLYHQARRGFRGAQGFEVRYWSIPELQRLFTASVGRTRLSVDCYFGIGLQYSDFHLMPTALKCAILASEALRTISRVFRSLVYLADSVYASSVKRGV